MITAPHNIHIMCVSVTFKTIKLIVYIVTFDRWLFNMGKIKKDMLQSIMKSGSYLKKHISFIVSVTM